MCDTRLVSGSSGALQWVPGNAPVAVIMISLNEEHNMESVLENLKGWAEEVFLVDSFSTDETVEIALKNGVHVVQRKFTGFGDQWNFAILNLPVKAAWTMKIDPDERLSDELKRSIKERIEKSDNIQGISFDRRLWFMGKPLPVRQEILRVWKTGACRFSNVLVNEHPIVDGPCVKVCGDMEHFDSPDLHHWFEKQNRYSTAESKSRFNNLSMAAQPKLFGGSLARRMFVKKYFDFIPFRFFAVFLYYYFLKGLWRAGWVGYAWSRLRSQVYIMRYFKLRELMIKK